jgi:hypothetical protein
MRRESLLGLAIMALASAPGAGAPVPGAASITGVAVVAELVPPADLDLILSEARKKQFADAAAWARFQFKRRALVERLDESGVVFEREEFESVLTPVSGGFDEALVRFNGRAPSPAEVNRHRRIGRFGKHYAALVAGEGDEGAEGAFSLSRLLQLSSYSYAGQETFGVVACHRLDFSPQITGSGDGLAGRFTAAMEGSLWITLDGQHLAGAHARTLRPISIALSLVKIHALEVSLESQQVEAGIWLPLRIEVKTDARILVKRIRRRSVYEYSDFVRLSPGPFSGGGAPGPP